MTLPRLTKTSFQLFITVFLLIYSLIKADPLFAASIFLNPATGTIDSQSSQVRITLDTEDNAQIDAVKVYLSYDPSVIKIVRVNNGDLDTYTVKEIDPAVGLVTIEGNFLSNPFDNQILEIAALDIEALKNNASATIEVLTTNPYTSEVTDTSGLNVLSSTVDSNLTTSYATTPGVNYTSNTNVPNTGSYTFFNVAIISLALIFLSFVIKKNAVSKF